ncbi:hypothetical protein [Reyranella sp. CPCC 100927]|uniref:hypothetical protein n=1 Tax=Reyranella sp. CPCC 100927 TaxID=2599616 RepID=UPI0011B80602|nr:hypothetical protein [Reyranella sp. CPCC 100927]TWT10526.1 hypothetical protein FQU96_15510 [Reyranella sp. CPCC 100927]
MRWPEVGTIGRHMLFAVLFVGLQGVAAIAKAQPSPERILAIVIHGLQTGQVNQGWFGQQLLQVIYQQTNGTFVYNKLVELGPVQNIQIMGQQPVPQGMIYAMRAFHPGGATDWQMGFSQMSNRIEYLAINVVGSTPSPSGPPPVSRQPDPQARPFPRVQPHQPEPPDSDPPPQRPSPPLAGPPSMPTPSPPPPRGGTGGSEACRLYPNLC